MSILPGVLAFQGDFLEHLAVLEKLGFKPIKVRTEQDLNQVTHLIIPGGESTVIGKFLQNTGLGEHIKNKVQSKKISVYGTCAGAILLAKEIVSQIPIFNLGLIDTKISRNSYGSQIDSFSEKINFLPNDKQITATFIRAPKVISYKNNVQVLAVRNSIEKEVICLQQGNVLISTFHPELNNDTTLHNYFLQQV